MGWRNTGQVATLLTGNGPRTKGLSQQARNCLWCMARYAKDDQDSPDPDDITSRYYGGWTLLAQALGYPEYDDRAHQAVKRAIRELVASGLVESEGRTGTRGNRVYRLHLLIPSR